MALNKTLNKKKLVELQNYLFGTQEKKLQVSIGFLDKMLSNYVYKRMRLVNTNIERTYKTNSPEIFFGSFNNAILLLNELENMQQYFSFNYPYPEVYKKSLIDSKASSVNDLIERSWKRVHGNSDLIDKHYTADEKRDMYINQFQKFATELTKGNLKKLNEVTKSDKFDLSEDDVEESAESNSNENIDTSAENNNAENNKTETNININESKSTENKTDVNKEAEKVKA